MIYALFRTVLVFAAAGMATGGCARQSSDQREQDVANERIAAAIAHQGADLMDEMVLEFAFRDKRFRVMRNRGLFQYERTFVDSTGTVRDVVNNYEVFREINGRRVALDSVKHRSVYVDVNSVVYFALLPQPLGDPAVQPRHLGSTTIDGRSYDEIEVTFRQEGGGLDYQDRFVYWIGTDEPVIDYMAYWYYTDGGGSRFRRATERRRVGGILFADYENYAARHDTLFAEIEDYDRLYSADGLELVSRIELLDIEISPVGAETQMPQPEDTD